MDVKIAKRNSFFNVLLGAYLGLSCDCYAQAAVDSSESTMQSGQRKYIKLCSNCHGKALAGTEAAPPLRGDLFERRWAGLERGQFVSLIKSTMPPGRAGAFSSDTYNEIAAFVLSASGISDAVENSEYGTVELNGNRQREMGENIPRTRARGWPLTTDVMMPKWPTKANPLDTISLVSDDLLRHPPDSSWLTWRRTLDANGFTPLKQIDKANVHELRLAWTIALPAGPVEATPLVHDGVMFVNGYSDHILALDAASGDELWHYVYQVSEDETETVHRNIALYEDKIYFSASDTTMVALDAKSGREVWKQKIGDYEQAETKGGPLVISGVVMQGVNSAGHSGGEYVVGLNAATGQRLWRFNTVARPDAPNGNTWNGLPLERRTGGSVWTAGSYDEQLQLAFFGPAPTYDTRALVTGRSRLHRNNDALYTDTTIALDPSSGRLVWHYQHLANDQWDFDWAFERQIVQLPMGEQSRKVVVTIGKQAILDALDASEGRYLFSIDLGLQNVVEFIDSKSGKKHVNKQLMPGRGKSITVCPHAAGARSWQPTSYNPDSRVIYVPLVESCMDMTPQLTGEPSLLTTGNKITLRPILNSDGRFGRLQAIDLQARRSKWTARQRAPQTTGTLATGGGVVFAGALDRWFTAYDADTGTGLWKTRLSNVPTSTPISYSVQGKQYVAIVSSSVFGFSSTFQSLVPEIRAPDSGGSTLWAFALP